MTGPSLDHAARLEANALIDRLVTDGATFSSADARRLIDLVPVTRAAKFSFIGTLMSPGRHFKGEAAGIGDVTMTEEGRERRIALKAPPVHRIGGYEVTHAPGEIRIDLMWHHTRFDQTGQSCTLLYDTRTGAPQEMRIAQQKTLQLLFIQLAYVSYGPWKTPLS
ncbi:hypothetical protein [Microvirga brassicacearum]|uniref:hypothetical protein n=1 Tax=Microvirga brassicacearum TaxID=2580413 RepID=UPI001913EBC5|nr:hypothetical protein [Microvirga brassicacearum]